MNTEIVHAKCPQCGRIAELVLTTDEARKAKEEGWYVSCPNCMAAYVHHVQVIEEK